MSAKSKPWGTIFLDASRETTLESLDVMQAPLEQERKAREAEQAYLERVRAKAAERAREILEHSYIERQKILDAAAEEMRPIREEALALREEARALHTAARQARAEADSQLLAAQTEREAGHEAGFNHGMTLAEAELERARTELGVSIGYLLHAVQKGCSHIFDGWRQELVALCKVCVEKGTALVLEERHVHIVERLLMDAVQQLEQRHTLTLRVHPDHEAFVSDTLLSAREQIPQLDQWMVVGDANMMQGGIVVESASSAVDSRLELRRDIVENVVRHLTLPETALDHAAQAAVDAACADAMAQVNVLAPPLPPEVPEMLVNEEPLAPEASELSELSEMSPDIFEDSVSPLTEEHIAFETPALDESQDAIDTPLEIVETSPTQSPRATNPTLAELEEELLPVPEYAHITTTDSVLATGGFLDAPLKGNFPQGK